MKIVWLTIILCVSILSADEKFGEKVTQYNKVLQQKRKLNQDKKKLTQAIISEMSDEEMETADFKVACHPRLSIRTTLEEARKLGATKMVEQVDKEKIKELYLSGIPVAGVKKLPVLSVKPKAAR
jgi:hypothetical protein